MKHQNIRTVEIANIERLSADALAFSFAISEEDKEVFEFKAGQYVTVVFEIDGKEERRSYSLCSSPHEGIYKVGVKRVPGGLISNHMADNLNVGDKIQLISPEGNFTHAPAAEREAQHYMIAAGSGITPILSHIKNLLEEEPLSSIYLLYGNRSEDNVMFKNELESLEKRYEGQFFMTHCYSTKSSGGFLSKVFGRQNNSPLSGRIDNSNIKQFFKSYPIEKKEFFGVVCGPGDMNDVVSTLLDKRGFSKKSIIKESFGLAPSAPVETDFTGASNVTILLDGEQIEMQLTPEDKVLEKLLDAGYHPPYSCKSGACSSCIAKIKVGSVNMDSHHALDDEEIEDGYILTCQSRVASSDITIEYL